MCDKCENNKPELELATELSELKSSPPSLDEPFLFAPPLEISTENLAEDIEFDADDFHRGLKDASYTCGMYTALVNAGIPLEDAMAFIFNDMSMRMNIKIAEITANANIESSKNVSIMKDKESL